MRGNPPSSRAPIPEPPNPQPPNPQPRAPSPPIPSPDHVSINGTLPSPQSEKGPPVDNTRIHRILGEVGALAFPGVYDTLSAKICQRIGFPMSFVSGYSVAATTIGEPDLGLLTQTEMIDRARRICMSVEIPVVVDADTGYGNPLNVYRTVDELIAAGAAGWCHRRDLREAPRRRHDAWPPSVDDGVRRVQRADRRRAEVRHGRTLRGRLTLRFPTRPAQQPCFSSFARSVSAVKGLTR